MSHDFWMGLLCIPVLIAGCALAFIAILGAIWAQATWMGTAYKLWPRSSKREHLITVLASAKSARYLWIPGWHVMICRTYPGAANEGDQRRMLKVRYAVYRVLDEIDQEEAKGSISLTTR